MKTIEGLKKYDLNCNIFSVYDYEELTINELLCKFFTKINECIKVSNETVDLAKWLVNEGLSIEVVKKLMTWLNDGTIENLINVNLFNSLNEKIKGLSSQLEHIINVDSFKTNTNTDQEAVDLALLEFKKRGGGILNFGAREYLCNFEIESNICIKGQGCGVTILKSVPGSNKDVISTKDFNTLTDITTVGDNLGSHYVEIENITIDGNKNKNDFGYGIRIWGASLRFTNVVVQNCVNDGILTQYTTHSTPIDGNDVRNVALESYYNNIKTLNNNGNGWTYNGPHDSSISDFVTFGNKGWGLKTRNKHASLRGYHWNSWLNDIGSFYIGTSAWLNKIACTGAYIGTGIEIERGSGNITLTDLYVSGHTTGVILRGSNVRVNGNFIENRDANKTTGDAIVIEYATNYSIDITGSENFNVFKIINSNGRNIINANVLIPAFGTLQTGDALKTVGEVNVITDGSVATQVKGLGGKEMYCGGYTYTLPNVTGTILTDMSYPTSSKRGGVKQQPMMEYINSGTTINHTHINAIIDVLKLSGLMSMS